MKTFMELMYENTLNESSTLSKLGATYEQIKTVYDKANSKWADYNEYVIPKADAKFNKLGTKKAVKDFFSGEKNRRGMLVGFDSEDNLYIVSNWTSNKHTDIHGTGDGTNGYNFKYRMKTGYGGKGVTWLSSITPDGKYIQEPKTVASFDMALKTFKDVKTYYVAGSFKGSTKTGNYKTEPSDKGW